MHDYQYVLKAVVMTFDGGGRRSIEKCCCRIIMLLLPSGGNSSAGDAAIGIIAVRPPPSAEGFAVALQIGRRLVGGRGGAAPAAPHRSLFVTVFLLLLCTIRRRGVHRRGRLSRC